MSHPLDCRESNKLKRCPVLLVAATLWKTESDPVFFRTAAATVVPLSNARRGRFLFPLEVKLKLLFVSEQNTACFAVAHLEASLAPVLHYVTTPTNGH